MNRREILDILETLAIEYPDIDIKKYIEYVNSTTDEELNTERWQKRLERYDRILGKFVGIKEQEMEK